MNASFPIARKLGPWLTIACLALSAMPSAADSVLPNPDTFDPPQNQQNVSRKAGTNGIKFPMQCGTAFSTACWPLTGGVVGLSINGTAHACQASATPVPNQCTYTVAPYSTADVSIDTFHVTYDAVFDKNASIQVTVTDETGPNIDLPSPCATATDQTNCVLTFRVDDSDVMTMRQPVSIDLVFDVSGSMSLPLQPSVPANGTRLQGLKHAAQLMLKNLGMTAMATGVRPDKVGAIFFSAQAASAPPLQVATAPAVASVETEVDAQSPNSTTSIGAGLAAAAKSFDADGSPNLRFALLFSDGDENTAPLLDPGHKCALPNGTLPGNPDPATTFVCPVATGALTGCGVRLLKSIAETYCDKQYMYVSDGNSPSILDANAYFMQFLAKAQQGDKFELVRDIRGTLPPGAPKTETFVANDGDLSLRVSIAWPGLPERFLRNPKFHLIAPDGTVIDDGFTLEERGSSVTSLTFPSGTAAHAVRPGGTWKVVFDDWASASGGSWVPLYQILVVADSPKIATAASTPATDPGTGEPIDLEVRMTDGGKVIAGANVVAALSGPGAGFGDIVSKAATPPATLTGDPAGSPARAKIDALMADPAFAALLAQKELPSVLLTAGADGVYRGSFGGATKEGHYQFALVEQGPSSVGAFERTQRLSVYVRPKPDAGRSDLKLLSSVRNPDGTLDVTLGATVRDRFGALLGPGYGNAFQIDASAGTVVTPLADKLDGTYEITYRLQPGTDPTFTVQVLGETAKTEDLDHVTQASHRRFHWWWLAPLLLLLL